MIRHTLLALVFALLTAASTRAQLLVGGSTGVWSIDLETHAATPLWTSPGVLALAADSSRREVYGSRLFGSILWPYHSSAPIPPLGAPQTPTGTLVLAVAAEGARGRVFVVQAVAGSRGIYEADFQVTPPSAKLVLDLEGHDGAFTGLAYHLSEDLFYGVQRVDAGATQRGVYAIDVFGSGAVTFVAPPPVPGGAMTAAAAHAGRLYTLLSQDSRVFTLDLATKTWETTTIQVPNLGIGSERGAAWAGRLFFPEVYCDAKTNSLGCVPRIAHAGVPIASATSGFSVHATQIRNQRAGFLMYGLSGRAALPFQGGTLCIAPPRLRTPARSSGGSPLPVVNCSGVLRLDMNAFAAGTAGGSPSPALQIPGRRVHCQWWSRDPHASFGTSLSDALDYVIEP